MVALVGVASVFVAAPSSAAAQTSALKKKPVTAYGKVTKHGVAVAGANITAWCGGRDAFGGRDTTDKSGRFEIRTNTVDCPLGAHGYLEISRQGDPIGFAYATILTQTMVNVKLEENNLATVPEFGLSGGIAAVLGASALILARRRFLQ